MTDRKKTERCRDDLPLAAWLLLVCGLVFIALAWAGCATVPAPPPRTLRLESYEQCVHYAAMFCQRSVEPPDVCTNDLVVRYCR